MIFGAYFTENYPLQPPPKMGVKIQWSKNLSNRLRMMPKRLPQSDFDACRKLPPAATRTVEDTKIEVGKLIFTSNNPKAHLFKPFDSWKKTISMLVIQICVLS